MMRWFLLFLVIANAVFFVWHQFTGNAQKTLPESATASIVQGEGAQRLELLSEARPGVDTSRQGGVVVDSVTQNSLCWMIGPLPEEITAKQVLIRLQHRGVQADLRQLHVITGQDYLLYIGPFASRKDSLAQLRELHLAGVDSFVITRGSLTEAIALGLFDSRGQAEFAGVSFEQQGYDTQVRENERTGTQLWLIMNKADAGSLDMSFWKELDADFNGLERKQKWCNAIASVESIE